MARGDIEERIKEHFAAFDRAQFAGWLEKGLSDQYSPSREHGKPHPFSPVYPELVYRDMRVHWGVSDFLERVYDKFFSDPGKKMFREAIGDVLGNRANRMQLPLDACKDLIYLIARVKAEESLDSLVSFAGEVRLRGKEENSEISYHTLAVLQMFEPSDKVYGTVERLADTPDFEEGYLFEVIKLLVKNKPANTRNVLEKYGLRINALYDSLPDDIKEREAFLECKNKCLEFVSREAEPAQYRDTWLTKDMGR